MNGIRFSTDQYRLSTFEVDDQRLRVLGAWLITDVSKHLLVCLDALAMVDDVSQGRPPFEEWSSENYAVSITPEGVTLRNEWVEGEEAGYPLAEFREAVEAYWSFLAGLPENPHLVREHRPDLPEWEADLLNWEGKWGRLHPYRGRLF
ncbi:hypothetical protein [Micromonospora haikouensis]|uniref:hypothetical protein n=1 Tax=Micromonospora haikouensis TaxID=686309 RepID=UPI000B842043|nr:hypothetical protein [Micromonospora haikouensis]